MRSTPLLAAVLIGTFGAVELSVASRWTPQRRVDPAIVKRAEQYIDAVLSRNPGSLMTLYRDDTIEMPPTQPPVEGRRAIEHMYDTIFGSPVKVTAFTQNHLESAIVGDVAYDVGTYTRTVTAPGAPAPIDDAGKFVAILKRTDGDWKLAYLIYNSNHPQTLSPCAAATESR